MRAARAHPFLRFWDARALPGDRGGFLRPLRGWGRREKKLSPTTTTNLVCDSREFATRSSPSTGYGRPPSLRAAVHCLRHYRFLTNSTVVIRATKLRLLELKLITSTNWNLSPHGHFTRSHGLHGPTRHPTAGANRRNDQKRPSCAHGRSANSRYAIQAAKGGHMSRLVRWS